MKKPENKGVSLNRLRRYIAAAVIEHDPRSSSLSLVARGQVTRPEVEQKLATLLEAARSGDALAFETATRVREIGPMLPLVRKVLIDVLEKRDFHSSVNARAIPLLLGFAPNLEVVCGDAKQEEALFNYLAVPLSSRAKMDHLVSYIVKAPKRTTCPSWILNERFMKKLASWKLGLLVVRSAVDLYKRSRNKPLHVSLSEFLTVCKYLEKFRSVHLEGRSEGPLTYVDVIRVFQDSFLGKKNNRNYKNAHRELLYELCKFTYFAPMELGSRLEQLPNGVGSWAVCRWADGARWHFQNMMPPELPDAQGVVRALLAENRPALRLLLYMQHCYCELNYAVPNPSDPFDEKVDGLDYAMSQAGVKLPTAEELPAICAELREFKAKRRLPFTLIAKVA